MKPLTNTETPIASAAQIAKPTEAMELAGMRALRALPSTVSGKPSREQARACWDAMQAAAAAEAPMLEPTPLPPPYSRFNHPAGVPLYSADQMHAHAAARDAAWQARCDALVAQPPAVHDTLQADLAAMTAAKDAAYLERNQCVALIARMALSLGMRAGLARTSIDGWSADWHGCVYIELPTGQVSWHYHDSQAHLFAGLPQYDSPWDGHDTPEKYRRVNAAMRAPAPKYAPNVQPAATAAPALPDAFANAAPIFNATTPPADMPAASPPAFGAGGGGDFAGAGASGSWDTPAFGGNDNYGGSF